MTFVYVLKSQRQEVYELRRNRSRHGKPITRDEARELISLPGTVRLMRVACGDGYLNEVYEIGGGPA